ncbi:MAG TPA: hypothetical protein ENI08_03310 [Candidatus Dependentiae bacterium]|nr:hypothetical protein [Candidatus Dependentiae bacterium]
MVKNYKFASIALLVLCSLSHAVIKKNEEQKQKKTSLCGRLTPIALKKRKDMVIILNNPNCYSVMLYHECNKQANKKKVRQNKRFSQSTHSDLSVFSTEFNLALARLNWNGDKKIVYHYHIGYFRLQSKKELKDIKKTFKGISNIYDIIVIGEDIGVFEKIIKKRNKNSQFYLENTKKRKSATDK